MPKLYCLEARSFLESWCSQYACGSSFAGTLFRIRIKFFEFGYIESGSDLFFQIRIWIRPKPTRMPYPQSIMRRNEKNTIGIYIFVYNLGLRGLLPLPAQDTVTVVCRPTKPLYLLYSSQIVQIYAK